MIKNTDLRIGNYILAPTGEMRNFEWEKVIEVGLQKVIVHNSSRVNGESFSYTDIKPVLLTDEVLRQCNFRFNYTGDASSSAGIHLHRESKGYFLKEMYGYINKNPITALHELQNIHFDLTGLECIV